MMRVSSPAWALLALIACTGTKGGDTGAAGEDVDADGDGYAADQDCDDDDATVNPGASELCDGIDNDCDALIDDADADAVTDGTWYSDADGDGFGDAASPLSACTPPTGAVPDNTDCDDADASVHPDATETCLTDADDDCDGSTSAIDAEGCTVFYADADDDGFGGEDSVCACEADDDYAAAANDDCDDDDGLSYPGAPEICGDGLIQDCDGDGLECRYDGDLDGSDAALRVTGATANGMAGVRVGAGGDLDSDGRDDFVIWSPGASGGQVAVMAGGAVGDVSVVDAATTFVGESGWGLGNAVSAGDINADGHADLLIGAPDAEGHAGELHLWLGPLPSGTQTPTAADTRMTGPSTSEAGVPGLAGDINGDGVLDLLLGAPSTSAVYLIYGPASASGPLLDLGTRIAGFDDSGATVSGVGDLDGDGVDDWAAGSPSGGSGGYIYTVLGASSAPSTLDDADARLSGSAGSDAGYGLASGQDFDGDGYSEVIVGAPGAGGGAGAVYVKNGPFYGSVAVTTASLQIVGADADMALGASVDHAGDVDGDGHPDLIIGSPTEGAGGSWMGGAWLFYGPLTGGLSTDDADAFFGGSAEQDIAGTSVAGVGDTDGDGFDDVLIGVPGDDTGDTQAGAAWLFLGQGF